MNHRVCERAHPQIIVAVESISIDRMPNERNTYERNKTPRNSFLFEIDFTPT